MKYFGSILSVSDISPKNAHGWGFNLRKGSVFSRLISALGVPHSSSRVRNRIVTKIIKSKKGIRNILDVGSGIGLTGFCLNQFGYRYIGIDKSKYKIDLARRLLKNGEVVNVEFIRADIFKNIGLDEKFDCALCMEVLEHVRYPKMIIERISKFVKKGGVVIFSFPSTHFINSLSEKYFGHVRVGFEPDDIKELIEDGPLQIERVYSFGNSFLSKLLFLLDFVLIKYMPLLEGAFFFLFYPIAVFDQKFSNSKHPLGYVIVLKK